jgi:hypothetical protein
MPDLDGRQGVKASTSAATVMALAVACAAPRSAQRHAVEPMTAMHVCPTLGRIEPRGHGRFRVASGAMRATAGTSGDAAEVAFTYAGPSATTTPLASGELRRQIGLKLRAKDTCNAVYVMWHLEPSPGIFVSVKRNPRWSTHVGCGDRGYRRVAPTFRASLPAILPGEPHTLRAELHGDMMDVLADGKLTWRAPLPLSALDFDGPAGIRSDNGTFDFELRVPGGGATCAGGAMPRVD